MANRCLSCMNMTESDICPHCGYPDKIPNAPHQLCVGTMLRERYQIGKVLGQGGYGITYLAWDTLLQKNVAIKEFFPSGAVQRNCAVTSRVDCIYTDFAAAYAHSTERFLREAQALVHFMDIPEVVDIQDFVKENNTAYIVMEYVRGVDLAKYVRSKGGTLSPNETFRILRPVMEALAKVHKGGIIHRDISPDNIILDPMGGAKLLDFGAVRAVENPDAEKALDRSTEAILKHGFAPIEQYNTRGSLGPWTDEYAMCATVWYCLTGSVPDDASIRMAEGTDPNWYAIPGLTPNQQAALAKGMACRPKDRYQDMTQLLCALFPEADPAFPKTTAIPSKPQAAPVKEPPRKAAPPKEAPAKPRGKKRWPIVAAAMVLAAVLTVVVFSRMPNARYAKAEEYMNSGDYRQAAALYGALGTYGNSQEMTLRCGYMMAEELMEQKNYREAADAFLALEGFSDSTEQARRCGYLLAEEHLAHGRYEEAAEIYALLEDYADSEEKLRHCRNEIDYPLALALLEQENYEGAAALFESLGGYRDSEEKLTLCQNYLNYREAVSLREAGEYYRAAVSFYALGDFQDSRAQSFACWDEIAERNRAYFSFSQAACVKEDGSVVIVGYEAPFSVEGWQDIVSFHGYWNGLVGLKSDGTVVATGPDLKQAELAQWTDIVAVYPSWPEVVGLKADGTLVATSGIPHDISGWTDIIDICWPNKSVMGLKADGTVVVAGDNAQVRISAEEWTDIVALKSKYSNAAGIKADGTVVCTGDGYEEMSTWTDIVDIVFGGWYAIGLRADGTTVYAHRPDDPYISDYGQWDVSGWTDIVAISSSGEHTVGLKSDGTVVATGRNSDNECEVSGWTDIVAVYAIGYRTCSTVGIKSDGSVVLAGSTNDGRWRFTAFQDLKLP